MANERATVRKPRITASEAGEAVSIGALRNLAGHYVRRARQVFSAGSEEALAGTGLRSITMGILSVVHANPGINQTAVAQRLHIKRANMVHLINELIEAKLIERKASQADGRAYLLNLTPRGRRTFEESMKRLQAHEDEVFADFSDVERFQLIALLMRIKAPY